MIDASKNKAQIFPVGGDSANRCARKARAMDGTLPSDKPLVGAFTPEVVIGKV